MKEVPRLAEYTAGEVGEEEDFTVSLARSPRHPCYTPPPPLLHTPATPARHPVTSTPAPLHLCTPATPAKHPRHLRPFRWDSASGVVTGLPLPTLPSSSALLALEAARLTAVTSELAEGGAGVTLTLTTTDFWPTGAPWPFEQEAT